MRKRSYRRETPTRRRWRDLETSWWRWDGTTDAGEYAACAVWGGVEARKRETRGEERKTGVPGRHFLINKALGFVFGLLLFFVAHLAAALAAVICS